MGKPVATRKGRTTPIIPPSSSWVITISAVSSPMAGIYNSTINLKVTGYDIMETSIGHDNNSLRQMLQNWLIVRSTGSSSGSMWSDVMLDGLFPGHSEAG